MKQSRWWYVLGVMALNVLVLALGAWLMGGAAAQPAHASPAAGQSPVPPRKPMAGTLSISKTITPSPVYNGNLLTYTLRLTNTSATTPITELVLYDDLPENALTKIQCAPECFRKDEPQVVPEPLGGFITIQVTVQLTWAVASLAPNTALTFTYSALIAGQPDGTLLTKPAYAIYQQNGGQATTSNNTNVAVRVFVPQTGQSGVASAATWFSRDFGGTIGQDWGDYDVDGDLDLALASSVGTTIYQNDDGLLKYKFNDPRRSYAARWADLNGDGRLELIAAGNSDDGTANTTGRNIVFAPSGISFAELADLAFSSNLQLVRLTAADVEGDGDIDLVGSTNAINTACPVTLFLNDGVGHLSAGSCLSTLATAAVSFGDANNDGRPDLALGLFPNTVVVLNNNGAGNFTALTPFTLETSVPFLPYDFVWGDYNRDGWLDLAAGYPLQKEARVYNNLGGAGFSPPVAALRTDAFLTPLSVDWADFNGDGQLDLVVADVVPKVYLNQNGVFDENHPLMAGAVQGQVWSIRGIPSKVTGDLMLALTRRDGSSQNFPGFAGHLETSLTTLSTNKGGSVAWGDENADGYQDLLIGAAQGSSSESLFNNLKNGSFASTSPYSPDPGPHSVAFGDVNNDGYLDVAVGTLFGSEVFVNYNLTWSHPPAAGTSFNTQVAWGDSNDDGCLDLLVSEKNGNVLLFKNQKALNSSACLGLETTQIYTTPQAGDIRSLAWADLDKDYYPDFAAAFYDQPARVYRNNGNNTFSAVWSSANVTHSTSVAFADYNRDGYPDLALGVDGTGVSIYNNQAGALVTTPSWTAPYATRVAALAWGDWNNDSYPDLAVANTNDRVQVYANYASTFSSPNLYWLWSSQNIYDASGLAWGDADADGDLDLAFSSATANGYFRNTNITPSHLTVSGAYTPTMPLPDNPLYVSTARPGVTKDAYLYSSSEILARTAPTVTIYYKQYDPDGTRAGGNPNALGVSVMSTTFEYSLDGGSTWRSATRDSSSPATSTLTLTSRLGQTGVFVWNARADQAISNDARFRVTAIPQTRVGPAQSGAAVSISPPFRVRALTAGCGWPSNATIQVSNAFPAIGQEVVFTGTVIDRTGIVTFTWDFGDGSPIASGQEKLKHTYTANGTYQAALLVASAPCPIGRPTGAVVTVRVGTGVGLNNLYLPLVSRNTPTTAPILTSGIMAEIQIAAGPNGEASLAPAPPLLPVFDSRGPVWPSAPAASGASIARVTTTTLGFNNDPAIGEDGARLAFWSTGNPASNNADGNIELFMADLSATDAVLTYTQVTSSTGSILGGFNLGPTLNAANSRLAFFSDRNLAGQNADGNFEIFLAALMPGGSISLTQVTSSTGGFNVLPYYGPQPDGSGNEHLVFVSDRNYAGQNEDGNSEVFRADLLAGGGITFTQVTSTTGGSTDQPVMDSSGARVVFVSDRALDPLSDNADGNREVFLAQIGAGGGVTYTQVTSTSNTINTQPFISADGTTLAYVSNRKVYSATLTAGGAVLPSATPVMSDTANDEQPSLSYDGTRLGFLSDRRQLNLYDLQFLKVLTATAPGDSFNPMLSGDGVRLAFASNREIYLANAPFAELAVNKQATPAPVYPLSTLVYTVTVTNAGPSIAHNVMLTDTLPLTFTAASMSTGCSGSAVVVCALGTMMPRTSLPITISFDLPSALIGFTNTAVVSSTTDERYPNNNIAHVFTQIVPRPIGGIVIQPPYTGAANVTQTLTATVSPANLTFPLTYTWQASGPTLGPALITHTSNSLTDTADFRWQTGGYHTLIATAQNLSNIVTDTRVITVDNPLPTVTNYNPKTAVAGATGFTVFVTGTNYVLSTTALWEGSPRATTFVDTAHVRGALLAGDVAAAGYYTLTISNPAPGGGAVTLPFTVTNPVPTLTAIAPYSATLRDPALVITLTGSNFNTQSVVLWNNTARPTGLANSTTLTASLPASDLVVAGVYTVTVSNPAPGGGQATPQNFTVYHPAPTISAISPITATAGTPTFTLSITGTHFYTSVTAYWGATPLDTTRLSETQATAVVSASLLFPATPISVTMVNAAPTYGPSAGWPFTRTAVNIALSPAAANIVLGDSVSLTATIDVAQAADTLVAVSSTNSNMVSVPATVNLPAGQLSVSFPVTGALTGGWVSVTAQLPANIGGLSAASAITATNPVPALTAVNPTTATVGGMTYTLSLTGSQFVLSSTVAWEGTPLTTFYQSATNLTATVPASVLATLGTYSITVSNPAPGGGGSAAQSVTAVYPTFTLAPDPLYIPHARLSTNNTGTFTVTLSAGLAQATVLTLATGDAAVVTTSLTTTLPANTLSTTFLVANPGGSNGGVAGQTTFTATLPGSLGGGAFTATVDAGEVILSPNPYTQTIDAASLQVTSTMTVTLNRPNNGGVLLALSTSNGSIAAVPATVTTNGSGVATFTITSTAPGNATVTATDTYLGRATTDTADVSIYSPAPDISASNPVTTTAGGLTFTLTLTGTDFVPGATVYFGSNALAANVSSPTQLTVTVPASRIAVASSVVITVANPSPALGISASWPFTITPTGIALTPDPAYIQHSNGTNRTRVMTVTLSAVMAQNTSVILATGNISVAMVPASVNIPANSISATFTITNLATNNGGTIGSTFITGTLPAALGSGQGSAMVQTTQIILSPAAPTGTVGSTTPMTVTRTPAAGGGGVTIVLQSSNTGVATVPGSANIPNGNTTATFNATGVAAGTATITATDNSAGGPYVDTVDITISNPQPTLTSLGPITAMAGGPTFTLNLTGTNFINGATVYWDGAALPGTSFINSTRLSVTVPSSLIASPATLAISVTNPAPAIGPSNTRPFTVTATSIALTPASLALPHDKNNPTTGTMTVTLGVAMAQNTTVTLATGDATIAQVPANVIVAAGGLTATFTVTNPAGNNCCTGSALITATLPVGLGGAEASATVDSGSIELTPNPLALTLNLAAANVTGTMTVTITGPGAGNTTVTLSSSAPGVATVPGSATTDGSGVATFTITGTTAGITTITASYTQASKTYSDTVTVTVYNPAPTLTGSAPLTATAGGLTFTLNLTGTNFVSGAAAYWNGAVLATSFVNSTTLTATVPASGLAIASTASITATNASPAIGPSASWPFTVTPTVLTLNALTSTVEVSGTITLTATVNVTQAAAVPITLTASHPASVTVSSPVTIAANSNSITFTVGGLLTGPLTVTGQLPAPLGGLTSTHAITVANGPAITAISPVTASGGGPTVTVVITGTNFNASARVLWDGVTPLSTTVGSSTLMTATISDSLLITNTHTLVVQNLQPGGGLSAAWPFTVTVFGGFQPQRRMLAHAPSAPAPLAPARSISVDVYAAPARRWTRR